MNPNICVVVPVRNRIELTKRFLEAFFKSTYKCFTMVIVDDASTDSTVEYITKKYPEVVLLHGDGNLWWTGATNMGVKYAIENNYDYVLTINNDSVVEKEFLEILVNTANHHPKKLIGSLILRSDNKRIWSIGGRLDWDSKFLFNLNHYDADTKILKTLPNPFPVEILNGNGTLIPVEVFKKIGYYNFTFTPHYHADSEIVVRAKKFGYDAVVCLDAVLVNEISTVPLITRKWDLVFWKKSDYYWRPLIYFYLVHGPKRKIFNFFKQYYHFFSDVKPIRFLKRVYKYIERKISK